MYCIISNGIWFCEMISNGKMIILLDAMQWQLVLIIFLRVFFHFYFVLFVFVVIIYFFCNEKRAVLMIILWYYLDVLLSNEQMSLRIRFLLRVTKLVVIEHFLTKNWIQWPLLCQRTNEKIFSCKLPKNLVSARKQA